MTRHRSGLGFALAIGAALAGGLLASPARAEPACVDAMAPRIEWAQGLAFVATLESLASDQQRFIYDFDVERIVVANPNGPVVATGPWHMVTSPCGPIRNLVAGRQYLITTNPGVSGLPALYSVAWEVSSDRVELVRMYHSNAWDFTYQRGGFRTSLDKRVTAVKTLDEAIYLITNAALPQTDMDTPRQVPLGPDPAWLMVSLAAAALVLFTFHRRISREALPR